MVVVVVVVAGLFPSHISLWELASLGCPHTYIPHYNLSGLKQHKSSYRSGDQNGSPWLKIEVYSGLDSFCLPWSIHFCIFPASRDRCIPWLEVLFHLSLTATCTSLFWFIDFCDSIGPTQITQDYLPIPKSAG